MMLHQKKWSPGASLAPVIATGLLLWSTFYSISKPNPSRSVTILLAATFTTIAALHADAFSPNDVVNSVFARFLIIYFSHSLFIIGFVANSELEDERRRWLLIRSMRPGRAHGKAVDAHQIQVEVPNSRDWIFSYKILLNPLCFGTKWEVPLRDAEVLQANSTGTWAEKSGSNNESITLLRLIKDQPSELKSRLKQLKKPISRKSFILRRLFTLFCRYLALCIYFDRDLFFWMPGGIAENRSDYVLTKGGYFFQSVPCLLMGWCGDDMDIRSQALRATILRFHWVLIQVVPDYLTLSSYHDTLSIIGVATGVDEPSEWPSMYGSITNAYTVRRFWSVFWHLLIYRSFSTFSRSILSSLGIKRNHPISRYTHNTLVFLLSGIMHEVVPWLLTPDQCMKCGCHHQIWRFILQVFGMMIETVVQFIWEKLETRFLWSEAMRSPLYCAAKRCLGYVWVLCWLMWVAELTYFPFTYCLTS